MSLDRERRQHEGSGVLVEMERDECLALLRAQSVGRVAVAREGHGPLVVPVNYVMSGDDVVFRTAEGTKLHLLDGAPASFQIDEVDLFHATGWSVLVDGIAHEVTHWEVEADVVPWATGRKTHWIRIDASSITGRRLVPGEALVLDPRGYL